MSVTVPEAFLWKLAASAIDAFMVGLKRDEIVAEVQKQLAAGMKPDQVHQRLVAMRDEAIAALPSGDPEEKQEEKEEGAE